MYSFDQLWDEFNVTLRNYINSKVSNIHDVEDILQNVFIKIYKSIDKLEKQEAIKPWIYTITKNTIIDFYKKKKDIAVSPETLHFIEDEIDIIDNMNEDISKCVKSMIFDLPEKYKAVYNRYENEEMKHKEIAIELDISVSASKVRLKRAKDMFKEKLLNCCHFEVDSYGNILDYKSKGNCDNCNGNC